MKVPPREATILQQHTGHFRECGRLLIGLSGRAVVRGSRRKDRICLVAAMLLVRAQPLGCALALLVNSYSGQNLDRSKMSGDTPSSPRQVTSNSRLATRVWCSDAPAR